MTNWLLLPSKSGVVELLQRAQVRQLIRRRIPDWCMPILFIACTCTVAAMCALLVRPSLEPLATLPDQTVKIRLGAQGLFFSCAALVTSFALIAASLLKRPAKYLAALPITAQDWYVPQIAGFFRLVWCLSLGLVLGICIALTIFLPVPHVVWLALPSMNLFVCTLLGGEFALSYGLARGWPLNRMPVVVSLFGPVIVAVMHYARLYDPFVSLVQSDKLGLILISGAFISLSVFFRRATLTYYKNLASIPVTYQAAPSSRRSAANWPHSPRLLIAKATLRGLAQQKSAGSLAIGLILILLGSACLSRALNSETYATFLINVTVGIVPLSLGSWWLIARPLLGRHAYTIYTLPIQSFRVMITQLGTVVLCSLVTTLAVVASFCWLLGLNVLIDEFTRIAFITIGLATLGYSVGAVLYPHPHNPLLLVLATVSYMILGAALLHLDQSLRLQSLPRHFGMQCTFVMSCLFICYWTEQYHQKGIRI